MLCSVLLPPTASDLHMRRTAIFLLLGCAAIAAHAAPAAPPTCDGGSFPVKPPAGAGKWAGTAEIRKLARTGRPTPPEIERIENGVVAASAGITPGVGIFQQSWLAYDIDRAILVHVDGESLDKHGRVPARRLKANQFQRRVNGDTLDRIEVVTVKAASAAQVAQLVCGVNLLLAFKPGPPEQRLPPTADGWDSLLVKKDGQTVKTEPAIEQAAQLRRQLQQQLYAVFVPPQ